MENRALIRNLSYEDSDHALFTQFSSANYLLNPQRGSSHAPDKNYFSNQILWRDIIQEQLLAGTVLRLEQFLLSSWFPRSPGLYFTRRAESAREEAPHFIEKGYDPVEADSTMTIYNPYGKISMLKGGVGCLRFKDKIIENIPVRLMSASSTPIAHQGFPVALPCDLVQNYNENIQRNGFICCNLVGRLRFVPEELTDLYKDFIGVPQLYLMVEGLEPAQPKPVQIEMPFKATGAVTFSSKYEGQEKMYASYVTFFPGKKDSLRNSSQWLQENYVEGMYQGKIITDFDEQVRRFEQAEFSLEKVLSDGVTEQQLKQFDQIHHMFGQLHQAIQQIKKYEIVIQQLNQIGNMSGGNINFNPQS